MDSTKMMTDAAFNLFDDRLDKGTALMWPSHSLLMTMHHYHMILVGVFVFQNLSAQLAVLAGSGIVESFNVSSAAAPRPKFFSTAQATPPTTTLQCHYWLTFLIYFTCNVIKIWSSRTRHLYHFDFWLFWKLLHY